MVLWSKMRLVHNHASFEEQEKNYYSTVDIGILLCIDRYYRVCSLTTSLINHRIKGRAILLPLLKLKGLPCVFAHSKMRNLSIPHDRVVYLTVSRYLDWTKSWKVYPVHKSLVHMWSSHDKLEGIGGLSTILQYVPLMPSEQSLSSIEQSKW